MLLLDSFHPQAESLHLLCVHIFQIIMLVCYGRSQSFHHLNQLDTFDSHILPTFLRLQWWSQLWAETQSTPLTPMWNSACLDSTPSTIFPASSRSVEAECRGEMEAGLGHGSMEVCISSSFLTFVDPLLRRTDHQQPVSKPQPAGSTFSSYR